jgi:peptidyl-prolyl cis-trans isomerase D
MATLQSIRNRAGIAVTIVIFLALGAFILGDAFNSGSSILRGKQMEIAEIAGNSVNYQEFQKKVDDLSNIYKMNSRSNSLDEKTNDQIREQTWQNLVRTLTMKDIYKELGIAVSPTELFEMVQGENPHPIIQSLFRDQNTGSINRSAIIQFLKYQQSNNAGPERNYWLFIENQIIEERSFTKYNNLLTKGLYLTTDEAKMDIEGRSSQVNIQFVGKSYLSVPDSSITVSESELKDYYESHKESYKQDDMRNIEYVSFPVVASKDDEDQVIKWSNEIKPEFAGTADVASYVSANSDVPFNGSFYKKAELSPDLAEFAFAGTEGDVYGPYKENQSWKIAKIAKFEELPDSVQARHILIRVQTQQEATKANALVDSLKRIISLGQDFAEVARNYSQDNGSAANGGDLGWFRRGMMVKSFEDAAFFGKVNDLQVVSSQFGLHLIQVTKRGATEKNVQLAIIERKIEPSSRTIQATYSIASKFASENQDAKAFSAAITTQGLNKRLANVRENDKDIAGIENSRLLVRAAFNAKVGQPIVSSEGTPIFELGDQFIYAMLSGIQEKGISSFNSVKATIELAVKKEKKAEQLISKMTGKTDLYALASELGVSVGEAQNVNFDTYSIPELGIEPAVAGAASALPVDKVSKPIKGSSGVYVIKATQVNKGAAQDVAAEKQRNLASLGYRVNMQAFEALRENANVVDKRAKFY